VTYGARLRELRAEQQLSLREVEERGGPNKDTMSLIERGVHKPQPQTFGRIAKALGMGVAELRSELEAAERPLAEAPPSQQLTLNGLLAEERRYRPTAQDVQALDHYLSRLQRELDEDKMRRPEVESALDIVRAFGPAVCASMSDETADLILVLGRRLLEKAKEMDILDTTDTTETEAGVTRLEEWRERKAS
jgi:transcriptional regulator with XRE-family HTH domain